MQPTNPLDDLEQPQAMGLGAEPTTPGAPPSPPQAQGPTDSGPKAPTIPSVRGLGTAGHGQNTDVSAIAAEYSSQDNPLMRRAATAGRQFGNERGLLNSSIAAQASQNAVLDRVIPMAQQTSQQRFQGELSGQEFGQAQELSTQEYTQQFDLQEARLFTERDLAQLDADTRTNLMQMESDMRERLAQMEIDGDDRADMMTMVTNFNEQYQEAFRSIMGNQDLNATDRNALLSSAGDLLTRQTDMIESLFGYQIDWAGGAIRAT